jgi:hypothetical protein
MAEDNRRAKREFNKHKNAPKNHKKNLQRRRREAASCGSGKKARKKLLISCVSSESIRFALGSTRHESFVSAHENRVRLVGKQGKQNNVN